MGVIIDDLHQARLGGCLSIKFFKKGVHDADGKVNDIGLDR